MQSNILVECIKANDIVQLRKTMKPDRPKDYLEKKDDLFPRDQKESPLNSLKGNNVSLLHIAAAANALECFLYLHLQCGYPIDIKASDLKLPFHYAVNYGAADVLAYILQYYDQKFGRAKLEELLFMDDYTRQITDPKPRDSVLYLAAEGGVTEVFDLLFHYGYNCEKYLPKCKPKIHLVLEQIIKLKRSDMLQVCLKYIKPSKTGAETTPLMNAIIVQQPSAVPLLLESNCDPTFISSDHKTAMSLACFYSMKDVVRQLADRMDSVDLPPDIKAPAAVHWICQSKSLEIAKILCQKGIDVNRLDNENHMGPYFILDIGEEDEVLEIFKEFKEHGLKVNFHAKDRNTILGDCLTAIQIRPKIIDWLLSVGADPDAKIYSPSAQAKQSTCKEIMKRKCKSNKDLKEIYLKYFHTLDD